MIELEVKASAIHGHGLFTRADVVANTDIFPIQGRVVNTDDLSDDFIRTGRFQGVAPGRALVSIDGQRGLFSYVNHARPCNCRVDLDRMTLVSVRLIAAGEELTVDYAVEPFDERVTRLLQADIGFLGVSAAR